MKILAKKRMLAFALAATMVVPFDEASCSEFGFTSAALFALCAGIALVALVALVAGYALFALFQKKNACICSCSYDGSTFRAFRVQ